MQLEAEAAAKRENKGAAGKTNNAGRKTNNANADPSAVE
jgi:hypothetical protein